jgi:predicted transcriptional regulator
MTLSDARKRANKKWNNENLTSFCVKLNKEKTEKFRRAAAANNTTPSAVIREAIEQYIKENTE